MEKLSETLFTEYQVKTKVIKADLLACRSKEGVESIYAQLD